MKYTMKTILAATLAAAASTAFAHPGHGAEGGFAAGFLHPIGGLDHILAMLAVGLWAASFEGKARWALPAAFIGMMTIGFVFGLNTNTIAMTEQGIAASVLVIGLAAAWLQRLPIIAAAAMVGIFALFHGLAHGAETSGEAVGFATGFVISTALLHAAGFLAGAAFRQNIWLTRSLGTAIGSFGLYLLLA